MQATALKPHKAAIQAEAQDAYTAWLQAKVQESLDDHRPCIAHDVVMADMYAVIAQAENRQQHRTAKAWCCLLFGNHAHEKIYFLSLITSENAALKQLSRMYF